MIRKTKSDGPEEKILQAIVRMLTLRGWYTVRMHGNIHQYGFPDLFCTHTKYGIRLVEVKNPHSFKFTGAQLDKFPKLQANGAQVWVLTGSSEEEYGKLFKPGNFWTYLL